MATGTTVDLIQILRTIGRYDETNNPRAENLPSIQIWADGSYHVMDGGNADIINSDKLTVNHALTDIHGFVLISNEDLIEFLKI